jgi:hypothetical protein
MSDTNERSVESMSAEEKGHRESAASERVNRWIRRLRERLS